MIKWMTGREAEESDVLLCLGVVSLFCGLWMIYPPVALIALGLIFGGLSYLKMLEQSMKGASNGVA